jgi:hypothetical protein
MSTRQLNIALTALLTGLLSATELHATPIVGVTASTSLPAGGGSDVSHIVDGSGLFDGTTLLPSYTTGALHGRAAADSTFVSGGAVPVTSGSITFDLGRLYALDGMAIWNFNGGDNTVGVKDLSVLGSTDGVHFTPIGGAPNHFAIGANASAELAELFSFSSAASFVRFDISSTYGNFDLGLSEVMFTGTPLPEPSTLVLFASGMAMLVLVRRSLPARSARCEPARERSRRA